MMAQNNPETQNNNDKEEPAQAPLENGITGKTIEIPEGEYRKLLEELTHYKDKYVRLYAEFDNARKRMEREKQEFIKYANEELIIDFLNIYDDFERSLQVAKAKHQDYDAFIKGIEMVMAHIHDLLSRNGVKPIATKGKKFDHNCHEVLLQEETDQYEEATVIEEFQKGYYLGDKVIRTAKVKLAKKKETDN